MRRLRDKWGACMEYNSKWIGIPYKLGGRDFNGCDCVGLPYLFLKENNFDVPEYEPKKTLTPEIIRHFDSEMRKQEKWAKIFIDLKELKIGDILCFSLTRKSKVNHLAVYMGVGRFLHIINKSSGSVLGVLTRDWKNRFKFAVRLKEKDGASR